MNSSNGETPKTEKVHIETLLSPIPNLSELRKTKEGYRDYPIHEQSHLFREGLVDIKSYGLAGQAYYSRPNAATGEAIPEVPKNLFIRKSLAEKLSHINEQLKDPAFTKFFGKPVELYIEDGFRSYDLQKKLYEQVLPHLIWQQYPGITDEGLDEKLNGLIAKPSTDAARPSPHSTGGAVDVVLRYGHKSPLYIKNTGVPLGHEDGDTSERVTLDYFEHNEPRDKEDRLAKRNRRAFYAIMTGEAFGRDTELQVNPSEWWHWSYGDQMWAKLQAKPLALYGSAEGPLD